MERILTNRQRRAIIGVLTEFEEDYRKCVVLEGNYPARFYYSARIPNLDCDLIAVDFEIEGEFRHIAEGITHDVVDKRLIQLFKRRMSNLNNTLDEIKKINDEVNDV